MSVRILFILFFLLGSSLRLIASSPAEIINLDNWKLTIPYNTERKGNPDEIVQPELSEFIDRDCFYTSENGNSVIFKAACDGKATLNSKYPRSELREMKPGGKDEASWSTSSDNLLTLEAELAIIQSPTVRRHVVCAQIHDEDDDIIMIRLEDNELFIERGNYEEITLDPDYKLGDKFNLRIEAGNGHIKVWYNQTQKMDWVISKKGCYYKIGCYYQSNIEKENQPNSFGMVELFRLKLNHTN